MRANSWNRNWSVKWSYGFCGRYNRLALHLFVVKTEVQSVLNARLHHVPSILLWDKLVSFHVDCKYMAKHFPRIFRTQTRTVSINSPIGKCFFSRQWRLCVHWTALSTSASMDNGFIFDSFICKNCPVESLVRWLILGIPISNQELLNCLP